MSDRISPEDIFRLHAKIRWTAFATEDGDVLFSQMRPGLTSYTSDAEDTAFMKFGPLIMTGLAERLTPNSGAGRVKSVIVNLEKDSVLLTKIRNGFLAVSADSNIALDVFREIEPSIQRLKKS